MHRNPNAFAAYMLHIRLCLLSKRGMSLFFCHINISLLHPVNDLTQVNTFQQPALEEGEEFKKALKIKLEKRARGWRLDQPQLEVFRRRAKKRSIRRLNNYLCTNTKPLKVWWKTKKSSQADEGDNQEQDMEHDAVGQQGESSNIDQSGTMSPIKLEDMKYGDKYRCYVCQKTITTPYFMRNHLYNAHDIKLEAKSTYFNCGVCDPPFRTIVGKYWKEHTNSARHKTAVALAGKDASVEIKHTENSQKPNVSEVEDYIDIGGDEVSTKHMKDFKKDSVYHCDKCPFMTKNYSVFRTHYYSIHHTRIPSDEGRKEPQYFKCTKCDPPFYCIKRSAYDIHLNTEKHKLTVRETSPSPQATRREVNVSGAAAEEQPQAPEAQAGHVKVVQTRKEATLHKEERPNEPFSFSNGVYKCLICPFKTPYTKREIINHLWSMHVIQVDDPLIAFHECTTCKPPYRTVTLSNYNKHKTTKKHIEAMQGSQRIQANKEMETETRATESDVEGPEFEDGPEQSQNNPAAANTDTDVSGDDDEELKHMVINTEGTPECGVCNEKILSITAVSIHLC